MKQDRDLRNDLKSIITRLGISQQDLANLASVTRQAISGVESGQCVPLVAMTLHLAKALGCQVEDLFWLEQDFLLVEAVLAKAPVLSLWAQSTQRWHPQLRVQDNANSMAALHSLILVKLGT